MNLAYLVNQYPQPSQSFIRREIRALEAMGHAVHRFSARRWDGSLVDPEDLEERERTQVILDAGPVGLLMAILSTVVGRPLLFGRAMAMALRLSRRADRGMMHHFIYLAEACVLRGWLGRAGCEHLHAHFGTNSTTVALLTHCLGGPAYSFTAHGPEEFDRPEALHLSDKIEHARFVVAISDFGRSQLYRWCPVSQWSKIHIIHCGLDEAFFNQPPTPIVNASRLVCVGRLAEQKGMPILIEAAARLSADGVGFELTIAGDGPLRAELERLIERKGLRERVRLAGWMSGAMVRDELLQSRAMVLASFAEGLPVVIMEALALGRPVVSSAVAGIPELVQNGRTGWLVPPGNVEALADAMRQALSADKSTLEKMGVAGAALVRERHSARTEAGKLAALFSK